MPCSGWRNIPTRATRAGGTSSRTRRKGTRMSRQTLANSRRWVVKVGSSLVTAAGRGLGNEAIADWCSQIAALRAQQRQVVLVSSGAVAEGMARLGLAKRPTELPELQAAAAV